MVPTYEYECQQCEYTFEQFQRITEKPLRRCPKCKGKVKRLLGTGAGIIFRGSGFYQTDYRSEGYKKAQKADTGASQAKSTDAGGAKSASSAKSE